jgi:hypothetical protein
MFRANAPASSCDIRFSADRRAGLVLEIDIGQLLPGAVLHDEAGFHSSTDQGGGKRRSGILPRIDRLSESGNQMIDRTVSNGRRVGHWSNPILRISRVVGKMKLIQKIDIVHDAWLVLKSILKRQAIPSEQVMLFWFSVRRLPILD